MKNKYDNDFFKNWLEELNLNPVITEYKKLESDCYIKEKRYQFIMEKENRRDRVLDDEKWENLLNSQLQDARKKLEDYKNKNEEEIELYNFIMGTIEGYLERNHIKL